MFSESYTQNVDITLLITNGQWSALFYSLIKV